MIPFNDLRRRVASMRPGLDLRMRRVLDDGKFILGPSVQEFEEAFARYCGAPHGIGAGSGTDALRLALEALGVGPGDEVITVANAGAPTVSAVLGSGATPVLVDVDPKTLTMDPARAEAALTDKTRCLLPVHLYGQCADMESLRTLADRRKLFLVEDCAQAHGAGFGGRRAGTFGDAACFSFYPTKNLGALGDGGMVLARDPALAGRLRAMRLVSRLDELQAAVLLEGLGRLDGWNERRRVIAAAYGKALAGGPIHAPVEGPKRRHVYHLYVVRTPAREALQRKLKAAGIGSKIHYPAPVHRMEGFRDRCRVGPGGLAVTEAASGEVLSLPSYPELTDAEVAAVAAALA